MKRGTRSESFDNGFSFEPVELKHGFKTSKRNSSNRKVIYAEKQNFTMVFYWIVPLNIFSKHAGMEGPSHLAPSA